MLLVVGAYAFVPAFKVQVSRLSTGVRILVTVVGAVLGYLLGYVFTAVAGPAAF